MAIGCRSGTRNRIPVKIMRKLSGSMTYVYLVRHNTEDV